LSHQAVGACDHIIFIMQGEVPQPSVFSKQQEAARPRLICGAGEFESDFEGFVCGVRLKYHNFTAVQETDWVY